MWDFYQQNTDNIQYIPEWHGDSLYETTLSYAIIFTPTVIFY